MLPPVAGEPAITSLPQTVPSAGRLPNPAFVANPLLPDFANPPSPAAPTQPPPAHSAVDHSTSALPRPNHSYQPRQVPKRAPLFPEPADARFSTAPATPLALPVPSPTVT